MKEGSGEGWKERIIRSIVAGSVTGALLLVDCLEGGRGGCISDDDDDGVAVVARGFDSPSSPPASCSSLDDDLCEEIMIGTTISTPATTDSGRSLDGVLQTPSPRRARSVSFNEDVKVSISSARCDMLSCHEQNGNGSSWQQSVPYVLARCTIPGTTAVNSLFCTTGGRART